jgi:uridine kinase
LTDQLDSLLVPLADGLSGSYRRFDWDADRFAETVTVEPVDLLVLEGVGSGSLRHAALVTTLVWVSVPHELRMRRGLERDGAAVQAHGRQWAIDEAEHFVSERTRERADLLVDGTGTSLPEH